MHSLQIQFNQAWESFERIVDSQRPLLVAVSGGVDSVVLLHLLIQKTGPEALSVVHFDHQVRPNSRKDALWVKELAFSLGIKKVFLGKRKGAGVSEEALREERYRFFKSTQKSIHAQAIVLAHHAEDQLETLLMRLIRGTRFTGLGSMRKIQSSLWRPLLEISKTEIIAFAKDLKLSFLEDETNQSPKYFRNRIRAELVPPLMSLSQNYGGKEKFLKRLSFLLQEIQTLEDETSIEAQRWLSSQVEKTRCWWSFSKEAWDSIGLTLQRAVAESLWNGLVQDTLETKEIQQLQRIISKKSRTVLSGEVEVLSSFGKVYLISSVQRNQQNKIKKSGPWIFIQGASKRTLKNKFKIQNYELRFLKEGDTFQGKKMKRLIWKEKIPLVHRALMPVLAKKNSSELLWYFPKKFDQAERIAAPWES